MFSLSVSSVSNLVEITRAICTALRKISKESENAHVILREMLFSSVLSILQHKLSPKGAAGKP